MGTRNVIQRIRSVSVPEGAGVTVQRSIGTPARRNLDPFLMLDHFSSENPDEYVAGFPEHPHRGFVTLTYMLDGHMLHRDSMGNQGDIRSGGVQWMKAASGVVHSEMPQQTAGLLRGFQLWINLPRCEKMSDPAYQEVAASAIPVIDSQGRTVKIISGEHQGRRGALHDPYTDLLYLDIGLGQGVPFTQNMEPALAGFVYVFEGQMTVNGSAVGSDQLAVLGPGDEFRAQGGPVSSRFLLVAGKRLNEPIVQYGPFVMNTEEEIKQAVEDMNSGKLVRKKATRNSDPLANEM